MASLVLLAPPSPPPHIHTGLIRIRCPAICHICTRFIRTREARRLPLRGIDIRGIDICGIDIRGIDIRGIDIRGIGIGGIDICRRRYSARCHRRGT